MNVSLSKKVIAAASDKTKTQTSPPSKSVMGDYIVALIISPKIP